MAISDSGSWGKELQGGRRGRLLGITTTYANLEPAVSPVVDVVVTGLILLWRLPNLWDYLHFCVEMKKIARVCDKLTELIVSFCGWTLERLKFLLRFVFYIILWPLHLSIQPVDLMRI